MDKQIKVVFYETGLKKNEELKFVVIVSKYQDKLILCRHRDRDTYEIPGGHIEKGEIPIEAAKRELYEETGAEKFDIKEICIYSVIRNDKGNTKGNKENEESLGGLFFADVKELGELPESEIAEIVLFDEFPENLTYKEIQPYLYDKVHERGYI